MIDKAKLEKLIRQRRFALNVMGDESKTLNESRVIDGAIGTWDFLEHEIGQGKVDSDVQVLSHKKLVDNLERLCAAVLTRVPSEDRDASYKAYCLILEGIGRGKYNLD